MSLTTTRITQAFPLDSMVTSTDSGDGLPTYDRPYNASDLRTVLGIMLTDGVCRDYLDELEVRNQNGTYYVYPGCAVLDGLLSPVPERKHLLEKADVADGMYAHVVIAARFDDRYRDVTISTVVNSTEEYVPIRTDSRHEIVVARIDWNGTITDLRSQKDLCGWVASPYGPQGPTGPSARTDAYLSTTSTNAVRNSIVTKKLNEVDARTAKAGTVYSGDLGKLPADGLGHIRMWTNEEFRKAFGAEPQSCFISAANRASGSSGIFLSSPRWNGDAVFCTQMCVQSDGSVKTVSGDTTTPTVPVSYMVVAHPSS